LLERAAVARVVVNRLGVALLLAVTLTLAAAAPAFGWANGGNNGNGFGTHDWVLKAAARIAAARGAGWVRLAYALPKTDDPDTVFHDSYYHVYDVWGSHYGNAPAKVAFYYSQALSYKWSGNVVGASRMIGLLSHYFSDVSNPLHTDQSRAEERMHGSYESAVEWRTDETGENRAWVRFDGYDRVASASARTRYVAFNAHKSYAALVKSYNAYGFNSTVLSITQKSLNRAVNHLADIIITIQRAQ
jgi:hypothetical protein